MSVYFIDQQYHLPNFGINKNHNCRITKQKIQNHASHVVSSDKECKRLIERFETHRNVIYDFQDFSPIQRKKKSMDEKKGSFQTIMSIIRFVETTQLRDLSRTIRFDFRRFFYFFVV